MAYPDIASSANWSTCNGGGAPASGDTLYLGAGVVLTLDTNGGTFTCVAVKALASDHTTPTNATLVPGGTGTLTIDFDIYAGSVAFCSQNSKNVTFAPNHLCVGGTGGAAFTSTTTGTLVIGANVEFRGGSGGGAHGLSLPVAKSNTFPLATGGSGASAYGINGTAGASHGTITLSVGGSGLGAHGTFFSGGTVSITTVRGGSVASAFGAVASTGGSGTATITIANADLTTGSPVGLPFGSAGGQIKLTAGQPIQCWNASGTLTKFYDATSIETMLPAVATVLSSSADYGVPGSLHSPAADGWIAPSSAQTLHAGSAYYGPPLAKLNGNFYAASDLWIVKGQMHGVGNTTDGRWYLPHTAGWGDGSTSQPYLVLATKDGNAVKYGPDDAYSGIDPGYAAGYTGGLADQLSADQAAVNAGKADIKSTRTILTVTGTLNMGLYTLTTGVVGPTFVLTGHDNYTGGSAGSLTLPDVGKVDTTNGAYGVGGNGSTPTLNMGLWTLISGVVAVGNIVDGVERYTSSGTYGTYPTTATSQAAQLVTDRAAVTAVAGSIFDTVTGLLGTVNGTFARSNYELAAGNVDPGIANVLRPADGGPANYQIHGSTLIGTMVGSSGVPTSNIIAAEWVITGHDTYIGGPHGTFPAPYTPVLTNSQHLEMGAAVAAELNAAGYGSSPALGVNFAATFHPLPIYDLKDMHLTDAPLMHVIPMGFTTEASTRASSAELHAFGVGIHLKLAAGAVADVEPMTRLAEKVVLFFRNRRLANFAAVFSHAAVIGDPAAQTPYSISLLGEQQVFGTVIKLWFRRTA